MSVYPSGPARATRAVPIVPFVPYVFDDYRLAERCPHGLGQKARYRIPGAAGRRGYHDGDRARWIVLRVRHERPRHRAGKERDELTASHAGHGDFLPCRASWGATDPSCAATQMIARTMPLHCGISILPLSAMGHSRRT